MCSAALRALPVRSGVPQFMPSSIRVAREMRCPSKLGARVSHDAGCFVRASPLSATIVSCFEQMAFSLIGIYVQHATVAGGFRARAFALGHQLSDCAECDMDVKRSWLSITRPDGLFHHHCALSRSIWIWMLCGLHRPDRNNVTICFGLYSHVMIKYVARDRSVLA